MKIAKSLLAIALPLALSAGCAMDVGSTSDSLTVNANNDFGSAGCARTPQQWLGATSWPLTEIVAGDLVLTQGELVAYVQEHPGSRADLVSEIAATQLNIATGLILPNRAYLELNAAEDMVMAPDYNSGPPPLVIVEPFPTLHDFNLSGLDCFQGVSDQTAQNTPETVDLRDGLTTLPPYSTRDTRENLTKQPPQPIGDQRDNLFVDQ